MGFVVRGEVAHALSDCVCESGLRHERGIRFEEDVVHGPPRLAVALEDHLQDREALVDGIEEQVVSGG